MRKINLAVTGCLGRMGHQIIKSVKSDNKFKLVTVTENKKTSKKINGLAVSKNNLDVFKKANLIIDFTIPKCTFEILKIASKQKKRVVIGTTGFSRKPNQKILKKNSNFKGWQYELRCKFVNVKSHELFKRSEVNLFFEFPISIADAALGTTIEIPTIDGKKAKIKIPDGTQSGKQFRLKGKGMPFMRKGDFGDLYVQVKTEVPVSLNKEQKELLEKFRKIENERSNPSIKKFFQKARDFWKN